MNRLHTLLAATDFSAPSRHATQRAAMLAAEAGARLELVHILEKNALEELRRLITEEGVELQQRIRQQAQEALESLADDLGEAQGVSAGKHLVEGAVISGIIEQANVLNASLLIVAARGASFMRHWLLGATAERLLRKTLHPILVVKQQPHETYRSVLVPVDFSPWSLDAIRLAQTVAPQAEIILLHAYEAPFESKMRFAGVEDEVIQRLRDTAAREARTHLNRAADDAGIARGNWRAIVVHGDIAPRILEQEEEQGADLIVIGKHGAGMTDELLLGSVTKHVLSQANCDVLVSY